MSPRKKKDRPDQSPPKHPPQHPPEKQGGPAATMESKAYQAMCKNAEMNSDLKYYGHADDEGYICILTPFQRPVTFEDLVQGWMLITTEHMVRDAPDKPYYVGRVEKLTREQAEAKVLASAFGRLLYAQAHPDAPLPS